MVQIYVTEMPKEKKECPFWSEKDQHCNVNNGNCCLSDGNKDCKHLLTMLFEFVD